ncbi:glycosidase [candidate division KSB1 bacterium]|nr:glycosidase [candidate division KSB1 bacterium]
MQFKLTRRGGAVLGPIAEHPWESQAVLNPGAIREGDRVHMLYRAVEGANFSTIGYARLDQKGKVLERAPLPVITRTEPHERQGVEDPRITKFGDQYYIFYAAYDGTEVRVCAASTSDFLRYQKHGIVIPDIWDKDAMIFPEPVQGKLILIHRIEPNIQFAYFDSMAELLRGDPAYWQQHVAHLDDYTIMRPMFDWEAKKIGAGAPPIKTPQGWLMLYHGVDENLVYRAGAALLDLENPARVIARLPEPILEPQRKYELKGDVPNVVFPVGTAIFGDELQVYYGGADKVIALATASLQDLLQALNQAKM